MKKLNKNFSLFILASALIAFPGLNSCSSWFQDKVPMNVSGTPVNLGDFFKTQKKLESLPAPDQLFASQGLYAGTIRLIWNEVENATSYRIERAVVKSTDAWGNWSVPEESDFNCIEVYSTKNSYTDIILQEPGKSADEYSYHYFYRVFAENKEKNVMSEGTDGSVAATRGEGWLFAPPSNVEASKGKSTTSITLNWYGVRGASAYKIYRGESADSVSYIKSVYGNSTSYDDSISSKDQGTEFFYKVVAVNASGNESAFSSEGMGYSLVEGAPAVSEKVEVLDGYGSSTTELNIKWEEVGKTSETAVVKYNLYRTSTKDSVYKKIESNLSSTTYTDSSVETNQIYYYFVQTVSIDEGIEVKSAFTENSSTNFGFLLSAPQEFEISDGSSKDKVKLVWSKAVGWQYADFKYKVFMSNKEEGPYSELLSGIEGTENAGGYLEYEVDKNPYFKLKTVNSSSLESDFSNAAAPTPAAPENVTATKTSYMTAGLTPNSNNVYPVKITWEKPLEDEPAGYYVYRSTKTDSGFRKLNEEPVTECQFIDDSSDNITKVGVPYFYKVVSINSLKQGKKGNDPQKEYEEAVANATDGQAFKLINCLGYGALTRDQWFREYNKTCMSSQKKLTLMHKPVDTDKLGSETVYGSIKINGAYGTLKYNAAIAGIGAKIKMPYSNYADFYINSNEELGVYFCFVSGNTDTESNMSGNGSMSGTVICSGMYPGTAEYGHLEIKSGAAGGGYYSVTTYDQSGNEILGTGQVNWLVGEEGR